MTTEFQFGLKHRLYNWNMRAGREERGWSQKALGALVGYSSATIGLIENLRYFPTKERAQKIADVLEYRVEILFPEWLKEFKIKRTPTTIEEQRISLKQAQLLHLFDQKMLTTSEDVYQIESDFDQELLSRRLSTIIDKVLSLREKKIIDLRFGLSSNRPMSGEQVGREFNVTRERIRQIEGKALRKLRRPSVARKLAPFFNE